MNPADPNALVTTHMRSDVFTVDIDSSVQDLLTKLASTGASQGILYAYVIDSQGRLRGVIAPEELITASPDTLIRKLMTRRVITISASASIVEASEYFYRYKYLAFPVVDQAGVLLGIVDIDYYADAMRSVGDLHDENQIFQLIGVHLHQVRRKSLTLAMTERFPWLLCNIVGGLMAAFLSGVYEAELEKAVALALFIPIVLALAESIAIQSVTLSLSTIRDAPVTWGLLFRRLWRETRIGVLLGASSAAIVGLICYLWLGQIIVMICAMGAIVVGMVAAACVGVAVPNIVTMFPRIPRVAAGPITLACADLITIFVYFSIARQLLI